MVWFESIVPDTNFFLISLINAAMKFCVSLESFSANPTKHFANVSLLVSIGDSSRCSMYREEGTSFRKSYNLGSYFRRVYLFLVDSTKSWDVFVLWQEQLTLLPFQYRICVGVWHFFLTLLYWSDCVHFPLVFHSYELHFSLWKPVSDSIIMICRGGL